MDPFTIVLLVGTIIFLIVYYIRQYNAWKKEQDKLTWPREYNQCPDYWVDESNGICRNQFNLGKCPKGPSGVLPEGKIDFKKVVKDITSDPNDIERFNKDMNSSINLLEKCKWTKKCDSTWEGVDNLCA